MGSLTGMEVLHFMSMAFQQELSAINAVNQYSWQLLLRLLLNNSQLTPPICLTFTSCDTHTPDWGVQTLLHTHAAHTELLRTCRRMCSVHEHRVAVLRMMGCLPHGVMNLCPPSASLKDSRITFCHNRVDTHNAHTTTTTSYPCFESVIA